MAKKKQCRMNAIIQFSQDQSVSIDQMHDYDVVGIAVDAKTIRFIKNRYGAEGIYRFVEGTGQPGLERQLADSRLECKTLQRRLDAARKALLHVGLMLESETDNDQKAR